jgi:predicted ATPase/DNA-binding SARP family transcriptional activator
MDARVGIDVRLLGRPSVFLEGAWIEPPPGKATAILLYLAFHGGWIGRGDLVYLFWPDAPEDRARGNLRPLLWRLGREPYALGLERERSRVRWPVRTDLQWFRAAVAAKRWREAWEVAGGDLLKGFALPSAPVFESWLEAERAQVRVALRTAGIGAMEQMSAAHHHEAAADVAAALHHLDPLDEDVARRFFIALARSGARSAALTAFDGFRRMLDDDLGVAPEDRTLAVIEAIRADGRAFEEEPGEDGRSHGQRSLEAPPLPIPPSRFVGRRRELAAIEERILDDACRLLTIVGPGGVGKTRLALEVASRLQARFRDGARFVDLAPAGTPASVVSSVAEATGAAPDGRGASVGAVTEHVREKEMLLVLDNLEHLADGGLAIVVALLERAPAVTILATSRVRLAVPGEWIHDLVGLTYERAADDGAEVADAITLFVRAARRVRPELESGPTELASIARICTLVEGLPLALELAAAWLRVLTVGEIERELEGGLEVLEGAGRDASARHGGMRAVFGHSWSLLRPRERRALRALAVFHGGWTREAAAEVAEVGMPLLLALIDASLIRRDGAGRYTTHALIGQYARERAEEQPDERREAEGRHARYYLRLVTERRSDWGRHDGARLRAEVDAEWANVRAAWRWAIAQGEGEALTAAMDGLTSLTTTSHRIGVLLDLVHEVHAWSAPKSRLRGKALLCLGAVATWRGADDAVDEGTENLVTSLALLEALGDPSGVATACRFLGLGRARQGRHAESRALWERARLIHASQGDAEGVAMMLNNLGNTAPTFDERTDLLRQAIALAAGADELFPEALASSNLGQELFQRNGATDEAVGLVTRSVDLLERAGFHHVAHRKRILLAYIHAARGRWLEAQTMLDTAIRGLARRGEHHVEDARLRDLAAAWSVSAWVAYLRGDAEAADSACRGALAQADGRLTVSGEALARTVAGRLALDRRALDASALELAQARAALERVATPAARPIEYHVMARVHHALAWVRLLAAEVDLAVAEARGDDARRAAAKGLQIAVRSEQEPTATVALVSAACTLHARGEVDAARELVDAVRRQRSTPFEAVHAMERLEAVWAGQIDGAPRGAHASSKEPTVIGELLRTALRLVG